MSLVIRKYGAYGPIECVQHHAREEKRNDKNSGEPDYIGTLYWADPVEDLIGILLIQIRPYSHFNIRPLYSNVVTQAVVDSLAERKPKIMGYSTPR